MYITSLDQERVYIYNIQMANLQSQSCLFIQIIQTRYTNLKKKNTRNPRKFWMIIQRKHQFEKRKQHFGNDIELVTHILCLGHDKTSYSKLFNTYNIHFTILHAASTILHAASNMLVAYVRSMDIAHCIDNKKHLASPGVP